jgi:hypothetical protein
MISSRTIIPVDDVRLATGEGLLETRSIVTFSTSEMVTIGVNGCYYEVATIEEEDGESEEMYVKFERIRLGEKAANLSNR